MKIKAIEHKVAADEKQEDIDDWDQEVLSKTHVYETIIKTLEYQMRKLRQGSTEKHRAEDELIAKKRDNKEVASSSTIKARLPSLIVTKFNGTHID